MWNNVHVLGSGWVTSFCSEEFLLVAGCVYTPCCFRKKYRAAVEGYTEKKLQYMLDASMLALNSLLSFFASTFANFCKSREEARAQYSGVDAL